MKIINKGVKSIEYKNKILYIVNNIDRDKLNEYSEFMLGSITKVFTIYLILILHQNNLLDVNDKVSKYIENNKNNKFNKITILDIVNHKSGMKQMSNKIEIKKYNTAKEVCQSFINEKLFTLKKGIDNYSDIGYLILGKIIEEVTNMSYIEAYQEFILRPLKMKNSNIGKTNIKLYKFNKKKLSNKDFLERYLASTGGGLYSCVKDMLVFGKKGISLLNDKSIKILKKIYIIKEKSDKYILWHNGSISGGKSELSIYYDKKWVMTEIKINFNTNNFYKLK